MKIGSTEISAIKIGSTVINKVIKNGILYWQAGILIPSNPDVLFWLDGTIVDVGGTKYFQDKTSNARNFLITGYDFDTTWTTGFPYKSSATISAPAGDAVLIAADVNNFLYSAGGTPNQIPVVSLFYDIDYEHKIFCRHATQVLDVNGVETYEPRVIEIVMYNTVKSGVGLANCQNYYGVPAIVAGAYYVKPDGLDTNSGLTWDLALKTLTAGEVKAGISDTAYVGVGSYTESSDLSLNSNWYGLGLVEIKALTAFALNNYLNVNGLILNGNTKLRSIYSQWGLGTYNKIYAKNATDYLLIQLTVDKVTLQNSVFNANYQEDAIAYIRGITEFNTCLFTGSVTTFTIDCNTISGDKTFKHCVFKAITTAVTKADVYIGVASNYYFNDNKFIAANRAFIFSWADVAYTGIFEFKNNYCNITSLTDSYLRFLTNHKFDYNISNNHFICNTSLTNSVIRLIYGSNVIINNNIIDMLDGVTGYGVEIQAILADKTCDISNNIMFFRETSNSKVAINIGNVYAKVAAIPLDDVTTVTKNNIICSAFYDITHQGLHAAIFNASVWGVKHKWNRVQGSDIAIVCKDAGNSAVNTLVSYNLLIDNKEGLLSKGFPNVKYYNNTIIRSTHFDSVDYEFYGIYLMQNVGSDPSINTIIKNNIIINTGRVPTINHFIHTESDSHIGLSCDYNIYYCKNGAVNFNINGVNKTFAEWQALGYDTHSIVLTNTQYLAMFTDPDNGDFSLKTGSPAIGVGVDLGVTYDDGLDVSTNWGDSTHIPTVVTKQQGTNWDIGAYIH